DATTNDISIIFSTVKMTALLAYSYGPETGGRSDFLALELISGKPKFSFGGTRTAIASIKSDRLVSDGKWHKVTVIRNGHVASMSVVSCTDNGEKCERCHPGDTSCYSTASGSTGTLNFEKELLYVGGIPSFSPLLERPGQLSSNDFIGCVQLIRVNGRQLDLSAPLSTKHTSNTCPRRKDICNIPEVCGSDGKCVDNWFTKSCICRSGLIAPNCDKALAAVTFGDGTFVTFEGKEKFRRRQLLDPTNRKRRSVSRVNSMNINFRMRTSNGIILYSATNKDYSALFVRDGKINYVSQIREEPSVKITIGDVNVNDAEWHTVTLEDDGSGFIVKLDSDHRSDKIDNFLLHPFLDPYLTSLHVGGSLHKIFDDNDIIEGFDGCMSTFTINDEVQPFNGSGSMFDGVPQGKVLDGCKSMVLTQEAPGTDPLNIGVILVIVFFVFLMIAILISFLVFRRRKQQQREKSHGHIKQNGNLIRSAASPGENSRNHPDSEFAENCDGNDEILRHHLHQQDVASKKYKEREVAERPQRPDIIEREVLNKSPPMPSMRNVNDMNQIDNNRNMSVHVADCEAPEHYDLENASSIAPSDIDIVYHYKGFRDGNIRKYKTNPHVPTYHKHNHRNNSPHQFGARDSPRSMLHRQSPNTVVPRQSPSVLKMQSTPLARLSPSSELSQQTPRILTLQDISGKPLQTALLATSQGVGGKDPLMNSERSLISPVSHLSHSTGSILANSQGNA
ncbi:FAT4 (predicted), partial [Pycnogonum litorale]